jgi:hypothetical protein
MLELVVMKLGMRISYRLSSSKLNISQILSTSITNTAAYQIIVVVT